MSSGFSVLVSVQEKDLLDAQNWPEHWVQVDVLFAIVSGAPSTTAPEKVERKT